MQPQLITSQPEDQTLWSTNTNGFAEWPIKPEWMRKALNWKWRSISGFTNGAKADFPDGQSGAVLTIQERGFVFRHFRTLA